MKTTRDNFATDKQYLSFQNNKIKIKAENDPDSKIRNKQILKSNSKLIINLAKSFQPRYKLMMHPEARVPFDIPL